MPITLPETLPAYDVLRNEGVMVMSPDRAAHQDIRPLRIGLLNLMPKKIQTENQFARLIGATPLQIDLHLIRMSEHTTKNTAAEHMATFYRPFQEVKDQKFDGLIITGARSSTSASKRSPTGMSFARSWTGPRPMCSPPSASAGAGWR